VSREVRNVDLGRPVTTVQRLRGSVMGCVFHAEGVLDVVIILAHNLYLRDVFVLFEEFTKTLTLVHVKHENLKQRDH
jgi:hypothetical protein